MEALTIIPATVIGYLVFRIVTHPTSRIRRKMPNLVVRRRLQLFPVIRINIFGRVFHLHHWINFSLLLALSYFTSVTILDLMITKGLLLGGILQGLRLPGNHRRPIYRDFSLERLTRLD